jgi:glycosyltransferase involved in cell wall biosynthesis
MRDLTSAAGAPLVSICVPTYNRAAFLREALATVLAQDYAPLEILISDNGSDDETEKVCREAAEADPRMRYTRQAQNIGLYANHNYCINESRGEFLCFFHDDDWRAPSFVREYVAFMLQHPDVGIVCSDWELINFEGERIGIRSQQVKPVTPGLEYIDRTLRSGRSSVAAQGVMIRRSSLGDIRFDEDGPIGFGDFVVWFKIAERAAVGHLGQLLWRCRHHRHSLSRRTIESLTYDYYENLTRYCDGHLERWPQHAALIRRWKGYVKRYLFWALMFEVGLHFRHAGSREMFGNRTVFELADYRLTPEEFHRVLEQLPRYRTGFGQLAVLASVSALLRMRLTWPLAWATRYSSTVRSILRVG